MSETLDTLGAKLDRLISALLPEPKPAAPVGVPGQRANTAEDALANARAGLHWNGDPCCTDPAELARRAAWYASHDFSGYDPALAEAMVLWGYLADLAGWQLPETLGSYLAFQAGRGKPSGGGR